MTYTRHLRKNTLYAKCSPKPFWVDHHSLETIPRMFWLFQVLDEATSQNPNKFGLTVFYTTTGTADVQQILSYSSQQIPLEHIITVASMFQGLFLLSLQPH